MKQYVVTVSAADRVGIIHAVTGGVRDQGGNILELSQTVMRGYFTIILIAEFADAPTSESLRKAIATVGARFDLTVAVIEAGTSPPVAASSGDRFILTVLGNDHPGNVHGIAGCLAARGVNIIDLHARTDGPIFSMVMEAFLPHDLSPLDVRAELERFGASLGLEAFVQHENIFLATTEPRPVRVGPSPHSKGAAVVPH